MGTQRDIVALIRKKRADYVLALKGNQGSLFRDIKAFFADSEVLAKCAHHKTTQKARSGFEVREYWHRVILLVGGYHRKNYGRGYGRLL